MPAQILEFANRLLPTAAPDVRPSRSIRATEEPPRILAAPVGELAATTAAEVLDLASRWISIGVIAPDELTGAVRDGLSAAGIPCSIAIAGPSETSVVVLTPAEAKGLEFDAVVVVEPAAVHDIEPSGPRHLYVALTRAVQHLSVIHESPLPAPLMYTSALPA